ncbi:hypothetical protein GYM69_07400 [Lactobacillus panisapium]|uniref:hypothetical protein n=1 Tax=Lactobacillus panisapium TaxID=2012495 RepID=UPI001C69FF04|nr:hypothetical protein [Lactobacillus panisapium]QYN56954.1 hypothetical protein GYM69_07400 [Lactobacillus panisapium]
MAAFSANTMQSKAKIVSETVRVMIDKVLQEMQKDNIIDGVEDIQSFAENDDEQSVIIPVDKITK